MAEWKGDSYVGWYSKRFDSKPSSGSKGLRKRLPNLRSPGLIPLEYGRKLRFC